VLKRLLLLTSIAALILGAIAIFFERQTTAIPQTIAFQTPDPDLGAKACQDVRQVMLKVSLGGASDASVLTDRDVNVLFACRLYQGLGETKGSLVYTNVSFTGDRIRSEAIVDLDRVPESMANYRLGSWGATGLSQIALKVRKIPLLNQKTIFLAIEGKPIVNKRKFVFYSNPKLQIGNWQLTPKNASAYFRIPEVFMEEWLEKEYSFLPMEPKSIFIKDNALELRGEKTAW
jgi:hypothetical protein